MIDPQALEAAVNNLSLIHVDIQKDLDETEEFAKRSVPEHFATLYHRQHVIFSALEAVVLALGGEIKISP